MLDTLRWIESTRCIVRIAYIVGRNSTLGLRECVQRCVEEDVVMRVCARVRDEREINVT